jgi:hypothetical protein
LPSSVPDRPDWIIQTLRLAIDQAIQAAIDQPSHDTTLRAGLRFERMFADVWQELDTP